jgi:hypothetical protein
MTLNRSSRGALEKFIDKVIGEIPQKMNDISNPSIKSQLHIDNINDHVMGWAIGKIEGMFAVYFVYTSDKEQYSPEDEAEFNQVIYNRMAEIREAIFKTG